MAIQYGSDTFEKWKVDGVPYAWKVVECGTCKAFDRGEGTCARFREASKNGCPICTLIYDGISLLLGNTMVEEGYWISTMGLGNFFSDRRRIWYGPASSSSADMLLFEFSTAYGLRPPFLEIPSFPHPLANPGSPEGMNLIRHLVRSCDREHRRCLRKRELPPLPCRVIDVGNPIAPDLPKLYVTIGENARYIAFSHCWGGHLPLTTTTSSFASRCKGIIPEEMPNSYKDVIRVAQQLGIRYIWIDSLCILQDDSSDWDRESAKMSEVYANAYLTIAATHNRSCNDGFLVPRRTVSSSPLIIELSGIRYPIDVRQVLRGEEANPLHSRGWAFQELIVSPRVLSFAYDEIQWYCNTNQFCECSCPGQEFLLMHNQSYSKMRSAFNETWPRNGCGMSRFDSWYDFVEEYMKRKLTFTSDCLPAFSALAKSFACEETGRYFAGLWEKDLLHGLKWRRRWPRSDQWDDKMRPVQLGNTPSWAWSSIEGKIQFPRIDDGSGDPPKRVANFKDLSKVEHVSCIGAGVNPYGRVKNGLLRICGPHAVARMMPDRHDSRTHFSLTLIMADGSTSPDNGFAVDTPLKLAEIMDPHLGIVTSAARCDVQQELQATDFPAHVWVLCLSEEVRPAKYRHFLVLGRSGESSQTFERLGAMCVCDYANYVDNPWFRPMESRTFEIV